MRYEVAVVNVQGKKLILVPVNPGRATLTKGEWMHAISQMQSQAERLRLEGSVVPVWQGYTGKLKFEAKDELIQPLSSIDWGFVLRNINYAIHV